MLHICLLLFPPSIISTLLSSCVCENEVFHPATSNTRPSVRYWGGWRWGSGGGGRHQGGAVRRALQGLATDVRVSIGSRSSSDVPSVD